MKSRFYFEPFCLKYLFLIWAFIGILFICNSCQNDEALQESEPSVEFRLTDGPAHYEELSIDIQQLFVEMKGQEEFSLALPNPGRYDLLKFKNGRDVLLASATLPPGEISEIRLVLGTNNTLTVEGIQYPLEVPSGMQRGLKLKSSHVLRGEELSRIWFDVDAARSVIMIGKSRFLLKPQVRIFTEKTNGVIEGSVVPSNARPVVYALNSSNDTAAVALPNPNGFFKFSGLNEGLYQVIIDPTNRDFKRQRRSNIEVSYFQKAELNAVVLEREN